MQYNIENLHLFLTYNRLLLNMSNLIKTRKRKTISKEEFYKACFECGEPREEDTTHGDIISALVHQRKIKFSKSKNNFTISLT